MSEQDKPTELDTDALDQVSGADALFTTATAAPAAAPIASMQGAVNLNPLYVPPADVGSNPLYKP